MEETWVQSLGQGDLLEKQTATHSSILPEKSREQRSLVGFSPWGHKRVRHNLATKQQQKHDFSLQSNPTSHHLAYPNSIKTSWNIFHY